MILSFSLLFGGLTALVGSASVASATGSTGPVSTSGTDFWVAFPPNYQTGATYNLFVAANTAATGTITEPGGSPTAFSVTPGTVTTLTATAVVTGTDLDGVESDGIHVTASEPVTIYGLNIAGGSSDAYTALPTDSLGTRYRIASYTPFTGAGAGAESRLTVVATAANTTVTITPSVTVGSHAAGTPYTESLSQGQVYTLASLTADVTGTLVTSNEPVAVYGSVGCAVINVAGAGSGACDIVMQEMPPTSSWGTDFVAVRYLKSTGGDPYRIIADTNGTTVTVNGTVVATLSAGQYYDGIYGAPTGSNLDVGVHIQTSQPAMVIQYQTGGTYTQGSNSTTGDPSMMLVPPDAQDLSSYTIATPPSQFTVNDANVVVPTAAVSTLTLDGTTVGSSAFSPIAGTSYSGAQIPLSLGSHTLSASEPFGVFVYGENAANSYAYPGGYAVESIAGVASVTAPSTVQGTTGGQVCVPATVLDGSSNPVSGIQVNATITGANPGTISAVTGSNGVAELCYTGTNTGTDTVAISALSFTATTTVQVTTPVTSTGYWLVGSDGGVFSFGPNFYGSTGNLKLNQPVFAISSTSDGKGYWFVAKDGGIFSYGDAAYHGSVPGLGIDVTDIVGMAVDSATGGYWVVGSDGGVYSFDAPFHGSLAGTASGNKIIGIAATPDGGGYYLVSSTGAVYAFGDAQYQGGANTLAHLGAPVVGMAVDSATGGYWEASADGGVFSYNAPFEGSAGGLKLTAPVVGIAATTNGGGYYLTASDGGVFSYNAPYLGSMGGKHLNAPITGITTAG